MEKLVSVIELPLPNRDELLTVLTTLCTTNSRPQLDEHEANVVLDALSGMTSHEAEDALTPAIIFREKSNVVKKNGLLEIIEIDVRPDDIGGLEVLIEDLQSKRNAFTQERAPTVS